MPVGGGVAGPLGDGARVPAVGGGPGRGDDAPVPGAVERPGVGGEFGVDGGPVLRGQARGFLHQEGGAPFVELPGLQRSEGVGHFGDQGFGQAEEPAALGGGFAPGQGDLRADPGPELGRGHPGVGLFTALQQIERDGQTCLTGSQGRLSRLPGPGFQQSIAHRSARPRRRPAPAGHAPLTVRPPAGSTAPCRLTCVSRMKCSSRLKCVGPLLAVHEYTLSGTCDTLSPTARRQFPAAQNVMSPGGGPSCAELCRGSRCPKELAGRPRPKPPTHNQQDQTNGDKAHGQVEERPLGHRWRDKQGEQFRSHGRIHVQAQILEVHVPGERQKTHGKGHRYTDGRQD